MKTKTPLPNPTATTAPAPDAPANPSPGVTGLARGGEHKGAKHELQASYVALIAGLKADYQPNDVFYLAHGPITRDELIASLQPYLTAVEQTKADYTTWRSSVQAERAEELRSRDDRDRLRGILEARYGKSGTGLARFGYVPRKKTVKTAASKTAAVAKAKSTREARGTKGSVQRQAIKGNVTGVIITPITKGEPPSDE